MLQLAAVLSERVRCRSTETIRVGQSLRGVANQARIASLILKSSCASPRAMWRPSGRSDAWSVHVGQTQLMAQTHVQLPSANPSVPRRLPGVAWRPLRHHCREIHRRGVGIQPQPSAVGSRVIWLPMVSPTRLLLNGAICTWAACNTAGLAPSASQAAIRLLQDRRSSAWTSLTHGRARAIGGESAPAGFPPAGPGASSTRWPATNWSVVRPDRKTASPGPNM